MSEEHDRRPGGKPAAGRNSRPSRGRLAVGAVGLAAVLGVGAYTITSEVVDSGRTEAQDIRVIGPAPSGDPGSPDPAVSTSPAPSVNSSASALPREVVEKIIEARKKMAKDGVGVQRALPETVGTNAAEVERTTKGSLKEGGIVRVVTARGDLSGHGELAAVAGAVKEHRNVPCSQTFRFSSSAVPTKKDNLLMCWRTTASKSVVAIVVDPKGHPSRDKAVDALEKKWRSMD